MDGQAGVLKSGAQPALGGLEEDLYTWLKNYKSLGVNIYERTVREKAAALANAAGIKWDFKASKSWLDGFLRRHELNLRHGQYMEAVRKRAVSPEALNRFFDNWEIASEGVKPENQSMIDEKHVNALNCGAISVSDFCTLPTTNYAQNTHLHLYTHLQVVSFDDSQPASIPAPEVTRHFSLMSCVNALGHSFKPIMMIQGKRLMEKYAKGWPECMIAMSESGYMTKEAFLAWGIEWEKETRPADPKEPRVLAFDGHFSHLVVDLMVYLLERNVRVCTVHPHTTHLTCVLDNGPFMRFNQQLKVLMAELHRPVTADDIMGLSRNAWNKALEFKWDTKQLKYTNCVTTAFMRTGLYPFNRARMEKWNLEVTQIYKEEKEKDGVAEEPSAKRPRLTYTEEERAALRKEVLTVDRKLSEGTRAVVAKAPRTSMSEILTSEAWIKRAAEEEAARADAETEAQEKREQKAKEKADRGGLSKTEWKKQQAAKEKAAKAAAQAAAPPVVKGAKGGKKKAAVVPPPPPPPPPPPKKAPAKRKRVEEEEEEEDQYDPYARYFPPKQK
jgi:hypothetical protein